MLLVWSRLVECQRKFVLEFVSNFATILHPRTTVIFTSRGQNVSCVSLSVDSRLTRGSTVKTKKKLIINFLYVEFLVKMKNFDRQDETVEEKWWKRKKFGDEKLVRRYRDEIQFFRVEIISERDEDGEPVKKMREKKERKKKNAASGMRFPFTFSAAFSFQWNFSLRAERRKRSKMK